MEMLPRMVLAALAASAGLWACSSGAADISVTELQRLRKIVLDSRQMGAHGLGYGQRSMSELARRLNPADVPGLIALLDDKTRTAANGATFALASQCAAAIEPVTARVRAPNVELPRFEQARETLERIAGNLSCSDAARERARVAAAEVTLAEKAAYARRIDDVRRRDAEDARLQAESAKLSDPARRREVSYQDCLAIAERSRKAAGLAPGTNPDADALLERARVNCKQRKEEAK